MYLQILRIVSLCVLISSSVCAGEDYIPSCGTVKVPNKEGWCVPRIELEGDLTKIFVFGDCKRISGLTCELQYNGKLPLPDKVLISEYDEEGKLLAKDARMRYYTAAGKKGYDRITGAMFWFKSNDPSRIILRGVWISK